MSKAIKNILEHVLCLLSLLGFFGIYLFNFYFSDDALVTAILFISGATAITAIFILKKYWYFLFFIIYFAVIPMYGAPYFLSNYYAEKFISQSIADGVRVVEFENEKFVLFRGNECITRYGVTRKYLCNYIDRQIKKRINTSPPLGTS